jgi:hypothetical protein
MVAVPIFVFSAAVAMEQLGGAVVTSCVAGSSMRKTRTDGTDHGGRVIAVGGARRARCCERYPSTQGKKQDQIGEQMSWTDGHEVLLGLPMIERGHHGQSDKPRLRGLAIGSKHYFAPFEKIFRARHGLVPGRHSQERLASFPRPHLRFVSQCAARLSPPVLRYKFSSE